MKRAKYATGFRNEDAKDLPTLPGTNGLVKLRELEGTIVRSEMIPGEEGKSTLRLETDKGKAILWKYQAQYPITAFCGQRIRVFSLKDYSESRSQADEVLGYELSNSKGRVLNRGSFPGKNCCEGFFSFVEDD